MFCELQFFLYKINLHYNSATERCVPKPWRWQSLSRKLGKKINKLRLNLVIFFLLFVKMDETKTQVDKIIFFVFLLNIYSYINKYARGV